MEQLPPLRLLTTFATVARLGSMRAAAAKLNVTQPAVTQALKALEEHVGLPLLDRSTRPARLTEAGQQLAWATREGLELIAAAIEEMRASAEAQGRQVTVACTLGMATYWLMPRLPGFYAHHPEVTVNVQAPPSDLPATAPGIDIALRYGSGGWGDGETLKLFDEVVCPVGRPTLVERLLADAEGLAAAPLIHVRSSQLQNWAGWPEYLKRRGLGRSKRPGQFFDNYVQAVQAALDGRGLVLGWRSITEALEKEGTLIPWPGGEVDLGTGYYATFPPAGAANPAANPAVEAFRAWLETHIREEPPERSEAG